MHTIEAAVTAGKSMEDAVMEASFLHPNEPYSLAAVCLETALLVDEHLPSMYTSSLCTDYLD